MDKNRIGHKITFKERLTSILSSGEASSLITVSVALLSLMLVFTLTSPYFLTINNLLNIGLYAAIMGTIACSMTFINVSGNFDISGGVQIAVVAMVAAVMLKAGSSVLLVIPVCLLVGTFIGYFNGFIVTVFKLEPFIATLASMQMLRGFAYLISDGQSIVISDVTFKFIGRGYIFGKIPITFCIMIVCYLIYFYIGKYTIFGRTIYMIGGNRKASFLSGIKVSKTVRILYAMNGLMAGISGIMLAAQNGAGLPMACANTNMEALSAVVLGGAGLAGGRGTIVGTFLGVFVLCVLNNGMTMLNVQSFWQQVIIGAVLLLSISLDAVKGGNLKRKV